VRFRISLFLLVVSAASAAGGNDAAQEFARTIRPVLVENCGSCHTLGKANSRVDFLKAEKATDIESRRALWRSVAAQLHNRTMPPVASKLSEEDRLRIATWVGDRLRRSACAAGDYAGAVATRRLNRREYHNTIRDLLGVDLAVADIFPADGSGGEGFDTNGETLYIPPMLMERYLQAAQQILDRVIITPPLHKSLSAASMEPRVTLSGKPGRTLAPGQELSSNLPVFVDGDYTLRVWIERPRDREVQVDVKVDGAGAGTLSYPRDPNGGPTARNINTRLARGAHTIAIVDGKFPIDFYSVAVEQKQDDAPPEKRALHYRLFGIEPGEAPLDPREAARRLLARFLPKAYRRPVETKDVERFLALYDRAAERGDPFEEAVKLALRAVLVSPPFLFRIEERATAAGIHPLGQYDMASRLSYFLWSTMPDDELLRLAQEGRLQDPQVLAAQAERMLDDPRSRAFANTFTGQWLGTWEVGGRLVPAISEVQHFYTPEVAADLREEPVLLFHYILGANRSLLELLTANYTFLTERLVKFYELEGRVKGVDGSAFVKTSWPDDRRAGVIGMGAVLAMTSHYREASPVLRGAWVLDTLLGTPVPPPPPEVPPLETAANHQKGFTMREKLERHRADASCATCHKLMDPIGFGLENFDWMGRWRDREPYGKPVNAAGELPSGEKFTGPAELRQVLLSRKDEFLRHLTSKMLGYALGRSLQDGDQCTVQRIAAALEKDDYRARTLIREVVLSVPFRNTQGGVEPEVKPAITKRPRAPLLGEK
jgi:mono/diheme cytochrome c family protein